MLAMYISTRTSSGIRSFLSKATVHLRGRRVEGSDYKGGAPPLPPGPPPLQPPPLPYSAGAGVARELFRAWRIEKAVVGVFGVLFLMVVAPVVLNEDIRGMMSGRPGSPAKITPAFLMILSIFPVALILAATGQRSGGGRKNLEAPPLPAETRKPGIGWYIIVFRQSNVTSSTSRKVLAVPRPE